MSQLDDFIADAQSEAESCIGASFTIDSVSYNGIFSRPSIDQRLAIGGISQDVDLICTASGGQFLLPIDLNAFPIIKNSDSSVWHIISADGNELGSPVIVFRLSKQTPNKVID